MSPRRNTAGSKAFTDLPAPPPRTRALTVALTVATVLIVAAAAVSAVVLFTHQRQHREAMRTAESLGFVRSFMTDFTSPDPFNANAYADGLLAQGTGAFAEDFKSRINEIAVSVARFEPTAGEVLEAGVERWNDDGSATVVVVTRTVTTMPDGGRVEDGSRWVVTAIQEGGQWKISDLAQVI
ncbi:mammalian cell entry protein [[Mycobacterium] wendilense]|uniref:Mammalian cell entry protein n=1 Tax=[Mycobacterium] wendilense TaxID=3064284 RepID=A0ABN9P3W8_9MYCO|nr:mammalian cell entry protein [Mycolicibacterium sp. MU0050]CAJ1586506.1 mammalian cell entry protein [Mycolicibacterium sp. MU0050]